MKEVVIKVTTEADIAKAISDLQKLQVEQQKVIDQQQKMANPPPIAGPNITYTGGPSTSSLGPPNPPPGFHYDQSTDSYVEDSFIDPNASFATHGQPKPKVERKTPVGDSHGT